MKKDNKTENHEDIDLGRRNAFRKLGLAATAVYAAPALMTLSQAHASSSPSSSSNSAPSAPSAASGPSASGPSASGPSSSNSGPSVSGPSVSGPSVLSSPSSSATDATPGTL